jgi:hypothetical protein
MWPAASEEDWKKPVLITWQRTWEDAVAVATETGRPILVCINMDGEIASEHYAGVRYRSPEIAPLYAPYVTVIASVYRHTPRDHDDEGRRIPCPRFGGVTCGEHIAIEPGIFEKFCDGRRIAPRHIMVEVEKGVPKETFDVYYRNDTASVFQDVRDGIARRAAPAPTVVRGDRPVLERVASREVSDRVAVEAAYAAATPDQRKALLEAALGHPQVGHLDLLRLAVFGLDVDAARVARKALASVEDPAATTLVAEALRLPMDAAERDALVATLDRLGQASPLARWLAVVHRGLAASSSDVDPGRWDGVDPNGAAGGAAYDAPDLGTHVESRARLAAERPKDPEARLAFAESLLQAAMQAQTSHADPKTARVFTRLYLADARAAAREAERLGATGWRVEATAALAAYYAGDAEEGYRKAAEAAKDVPPGDTSWTSMALLTVFAEGRFRAIRASVKEKTSFPPGWLADVDAAYAVLLKHPLGTEGQVLWHYDLLDWLGARAQATRVLRRGLERFADSEAIHARLRERLLKTEGPAGLEATYAAMAREKGDTGRARFAAGLASVLAAEHLRRNRASADALPAYGRALDWLDRAAQADASLALAVDEAQALALAGRARVRLQRGELEPALEDVLASYRRSPGSAGTRDGLGVTPADTGQTLLGRLREAKRDDLAARLAAATAALDPSLLPSDGE